MQWVWDSRMPESVRQFTPDMHVSGESWELGALSWPSPDRGPSCTLSKLFSKNPKKLEAKVE